MQFQQTIYAIKTEMERMYTRLFCIEWEQQEVKGRKMARESILFLN